MLTLGLVQLDIGPAGDVTGETVVRELESLGIGKGLVLLPELFHTPYSMLPGSGITLDAPPVRRLRAFTADRPALLVCGSVALRGADRLRNTLVVFHRGEATPVYEKVHLFSPMDEARFMEPGNRLSVADVRWDDETWRVGFAVCYDLRFPEWFRLLREAGCDLVVVPAQWPTPRNTAWTTLLAARAVENQCFVLGVNRTGEDQGVPFGGHSGVYGPSGARVGGMGDAPGVSRVEIDRRVPAQARARFDSLLDRRADAYRLSGLLPLDIFRFTV
ncbi:MAG: hypothetical protein KA419_20660 [Acidobacteria bacterium]|nr:hypothetical protein [Acidobacteriota bacterium]